MKTDLTPLRDAPERKERDYLVTLLRSAGVQIGDRNACRCPFHDDKHPSAGLFFKDGVWKFHCHPCSWTGDFFDVKAKLDGRPLDQILRDHRGQTPAPTPQGYARALEDKAKMTSDSPPVTPLGPGKTLDALEASLPGGRRTRYVYNPNFNPKTGEPGYVVLRVDPPNGEKLIRPAACWGDGWHFKAPEAPRPLYRRDLIAGSSRVVVVEGEKAVEALANLGIAATTSPTGAGNAKHADWSPLAGKEVVLWPDNDPPNAKGERTGIVHMHDVRKILEKLEPAPRLMWLDCDTLGLPPKGDAYDLAAMNADLEPAAQADIMVDAINSAVSLGPYADFAAEMDAIRAGKKRTLKWEWPDLLSLSACTMPGTVTVICGDPGASKSFWLIQALLNWHLAGHKIALFELEENRNYYLRRVTAIHSGHAGFTDNDWVEANAEFSKTIETEHAAVLDSFGRCLTDDDDDSRSIKLDAIADWVEDRAIAGCAAIGVDPITVASKSSTPWEDDLAFIKRVKKVVARYDSRLFLVTHPKQKSGSKPSGGGFDEMAGGTAYSRFPQTVFWMRNLTEPEPVTVYEAGGLGRSEVQADRIFRITKARNGRGAGRSVAFRFDKTTLRCEELGMIVKDTK